MQQRKQNGLLGIFNIQIFQQQNTPIDEQKVNEFNPVYTFSQRHKTTRHAVRYPPQFSTHHRITQATSTQGNSIIHYNSTSMFIFYQPIILHYCKFNLIYRRISGLYVQPRKHITDTNYIVKII